MASSSISFDVCVVGAGPASLCCVSAICEPYSIDFLTDAQARHAARIHHKHHRKLRVCVIDPNKQWLHEWKENFDQLQIQHLRSPVLAHPNMFDSSALLTYHNSCNYNHASRDEYSLYSSKCSDSRQLNGLGAETRVGLWNLPSTALFNDFCDKTSQDLPHKFLHGYATDLKPGKNRNYILEWIDSSGVHQSLTSRRIILAIGTVGKPVVPKGLVHCPSVQWNEPNAFNLESRAAKKKARILVVGGGLTAVQTALRIVDNGHTCVLCSRRPLQEKHFDIPIEWFDRRTTNKCLSKFYHDTIENRLRQLKEARNGGSIPEMYLERIEKRKNRLECWVGDVEYDNDWRSLSDDKIDIQFEGKTFSFDKVILATGISPDCTMNHFFKKVLERFPNTVHGGFPNLTQDLRWSANSNIFVAGGMAALQVGPDAGNLMGMRRAARAISGALDCRKWLRKTVLANSFATFDSDTESETDSSECSSCENF